MLDVLPWLLVPLAGFGLIYMLNRGNGVLVRFFAVVAALSALAAVLLAPKCMCISVLDKLIGALLWATVANVLIFLVAAIGFKHLALRAKT